MTKDDLTKIPVRVWTEEEIRKMARGEFVPILKT